MVVSGQHSLLSLLSFHLLMIVHIWCDSWFFLWHNQDAVMALLLDDPVIPVMTMSCLQLLLAVVSLIWAETLICPFSYMFSPIILLQNPLSSLHNNLISELTR